MPINEQLAAQIREQQGCHAMEFKGRVMPGFILIDETDRRTKEQLDYWIGLALETIKKPGRLRTGPVKKGAPAKLPKRGNSPSSRKIGCEGSRMTFA